MAVGGPFENRVLTHCSCCWGPLQKQSTYASQWLLGAFWNKSTYLWYASEYIIWIDNKFQIFSPKMNKIYAWNTSTGALKRGVRGKCLACLRLNPPLCSFSWLQPQTSCQNQSLYGIHVFVLQWHIKNYSLILALAQTSQFITSESTLIILKAISLNS